MSEVMIQLAENRNAFIPGEEIAGEVSWRLEQPAERMELRLSWHTRGKGTTDTQTVQTLLFDKPMLQEQRMFRLTAPQGPYSFSGVLIALVWVLELVAHPSGEKSQSEIVLSPNAQEIQLSVVKDPS